MHIALIKRRYDPTGQGAEKVASRFVKDFVSRGHKITVFAEQIVSEEIPNLAFRQVKQPLLPTLCKTSAFHQSVQKICYPEDYDLVYSMSRTYPSDVFRVAEQLQTEWLPINYPPFERFNPRHRGIINLERRLYKPDHTQYLVTNSYLIKNQISRNFNYPEERISVVRNGINRGIFYPAASVTEKNNTREELALAKGDFVLLFVASNFKVKGLRQAVETISGLEDEVKNCLKMIVVGGDSPEPFQKMASELGVCRNLHFVGSQSEMRQFYVAADLLFYPSLYEPFSNVCLEAAACKLPVLTTAVNGASELVEHEKSGYIVNNADNIAAMQAYMNNFFNFDKQKRREFAESIYHASLPYCWNKHVEQMEAIFDSIISSR